MPVIISRYLNLHLMFKFLLSHRHNNHLGMGSTIALASYPRARRTIPPGPRAASAVRQSFQTYEFLFLRLFSHLLTAKLEWYGRIITLITEASTAFWSSG